VTLVPQEHLPEYIELGGRQVWRAPYTARNATVWAFAVKADRAKIDALLRKALVEPAGNHVDYRCAHDHVLITFSDIGEMASGEPPDKDCGFQREQELSIWCLVADMHSGRLVWYLPYVFTDTGQTVAGGREVYGYPKQMGDFSDGFPRNLDVGGDTGVEALAIDPFGPQEEAVSCEMITVTRRRTTRNEPETVPIGATLFDEYSNLFQGETRASDDLPSGRKPPVKAVITPLDAPPPRRLPPPPPWARRVIDSLQGIGLRGAPPDLVWHMANNPTLVFLKQFRDASCPTKACYQAIIEAPLAIHLTQGSYLPLNPDLFEITIGNWASHPIAAELGIISPRKPTGAFRAKLEFDIQLGYEVWRAPT
jgi:Acetoacetate decarboxylase (ADC)